MYDDTLVSAARTTDDHFRSFIEVDRVAKSCIQCNFERLHVALALINDFG